MIPLVDKFVIKKYIESYLEEDIDGLILLQIC